jgi:hypothetical protein
MITKLTLSIEKKTIERAKALSEKRGKSISRIVEEYLNSITAVNKASAVDKLSGALNKKVPADIEWKKVKENYLKEKYGV